MAPLLWLNNHRGCKHLERRKTRRPCRICADLYEKNLELVDMCPKKNIILMGGCALNCVANSKIQGKNIWIMPSPGDAGSALGAVPLVQKRKLQGRSISWN